MLQSFTRKHSFMICLRIRYHFCIYSHIHAHAHICIYNILFYSFILFLVVSITTTPPLVSSPPSGTPLLSEMSGVVFICLIVVIVFVVFCCCGFLIALVLSHALRKPEPKGNNGVHEPIVPNQSIKFTESERKNVDDFNMAIINVLTETYRHPDTSDTVKLHIKTNLLDFISSSSQTSHHQKTRKVRTDGEPESTEVVVPDNRGHTNEPLYDEPTNPQTRNDNEELIARYVTRLPKAKQEFVSELECQSNPSYGTSTNEPDELKGLLRSKLPGTYDKFMELTRCLNSS